MSITNPVATNSQGQAMQGTQGSAISNNSATNLSTNQFLDLMLASLQNQNPLSPSSQSPTQYLSELAQLTAVEQQTNTAQSTKTTAQEAAVSQAISLIGDTVTYIDQSNGSTKTGTVQSVQITNAGPTITVAGAAGVNLSSVTNVVPGSTATAGGATGSAASGSAASGSAASGPGATGSSGGTAGSSNTPSTSGS